MLVVAVSSPPEVAVRLVVAKSTVTALFVVPTRITVRVTEPPPSATVLVALVKRRMAESLVRMVAVRFVVAARAVLVGVRRRRVKVSLFSAVRSFSTVTEKVLLVSPAAKERRPLVALLSEAAVVAVPLVVK